MVTLPSKHHTATALFLSALIALIATISMAIWQWHDDWQLVHQSLPMPLLLKNQDDTNLVINQIPQQHMFGKALPQGSVPVSNLQMQITGIVDMKTNNNASKVYISIAGQPSKIYRVGDALPYGVKIYKISADTVIFDNDGRLEKLSLVREKLEFKPKGQALDA